MLRSISLALFTFASLACGAPPPPQPPQSPPPTTASASVPTPVRQRAWGPPPPGEYLVYDASLSVGDASDRADVVLRGEWRAHVDGERVRVALGDATLEGRGHPRTYTCTDAPLGLTLDGLRIEIPAGGRVLLHGVDGAQARVGPPFEELPAVTTLVARSTLSLSACEEPSAAGPRAAPTRPASGLACLFGRPGLEPQRGRMFLPEGSAYEVHERRQDWASITATVRGVRVDGWVPTRALTDVDVSHDWVQLTEEVRVGPFTVPAGTLGRMKPDLCAESETSCGDTILLAMPGHERRLVVRADASDVSTTPATATARLNAWRPHVPGFACQYPDAPRVRELTLGVLDREDIRSVIAEHIPSIRTCYDTRLDVDRSLDGRVTNFFVIGPTGRVDSASTRVSTGDALRDGYVRECIRHAIRGMRFPAPREGGVVLVNYPFMFTRGR